MLVYTHLIRLRYLPTDVENLGFFLLCLRRQRAKPLTDPLDFPTLEIVDPTSPPTFWGSPLY